MAVLKGLPNCPHNSLRAESQKGLTIGAAVPLLGTTEMGCLPIDTTWSGFSSSDGSTSEEAQRIIS